MRTGFGALVGVVGKKWGWLLPVGATAAMPVLYVPGMIFLWFGAADYWTDEWNTMAALRNPVSWLGALLLVTMIVAPVASWTAYAVAQHHRWKHRRRAPGGQSGPDAPLDPSAVPS